MYLTRAEQAIFDGEEGESRQKAMELVTALGKIYGAEDLIDITSAHLSGASYKTIGDGGSISRTWPRAVPRCPSPPP